MTVHNKCMNNSTHWWCGISQKIIEKRKARFSSSTCAPLTHCLYLMNYKKLFFFTEVNAIQLLAVTETWLSTSIPDDSITLSGFQTPSRKDRDKFGGGVCIYALTELACEGREDLDTDGLEISWVEVLNINMKLPLLVGCCYRPPSAYSRFMTF